LTRRDEAHALLRAIPLFGVLDGEALDRLAGVLEHRAFPAGTVVLNEGDQGDCVYLVAEGELEIWHDGRPRGGVVRGDVLGEIALTEDVPRTATVLAVTDVELWEIGREPFLDAVGPSAAALLEAQALRDERLRRLRG
jgi:cAMP-dependent protein kinase regulator